MSEPTKTAEQRLLETPPTWGGDDHDAALDAVIEEFRAAHPTPAPAAPPSYADVLKEVREAQANNATEQAAFRAIDEAVIPAEREAAIERYARLMAAKQAMAPVQPDYSWNDYDATMNHHGVNSSARSRVRTLGEAGGWDAMLSVQLQAALDAMPDPTTLPALPPLGDLDGHALARALRGVNLDHLAADGWLKWEPARSALVAIGQRMAGR